MASWGTVDDVDRSPLTLEVDGDPEPDLFCPTCRTDSAVAQRVALYARMPGRPKPMLVGHLRLELCGTIGCEWHHLRGWKS